MPRKAAKKTGRKKKTVRRSPKLVLGGYPSSKMVRLRYAQPITLDAGAGGKAINVFRANSMYDPDLTGVGSQPANFDDWMNNYNHFTVLGSKIQVISTPDTTSAYVPAHLGILLSASGSSATGMSITTLYEQGLGKVATKVIGLTNNGRLTLTKTFSASKFFGKTKSSLIGSSLYKGDSASNPGEGAFFEVFTMSINGNNPSSIPVMVIIDYIAVLTEQHQSHDS